jgi:hypothetical protein
MTNLDASSKNIVTAAFIGAYILLLIALRPFASMKIMVRSAPAWWSYSRGHA